MLLPVAIVFQTRHTLVSVKTDVKLNDNGLNTLKSHKISPDKQPPKVSYHTHSELLVLEIRQ